MPRMLDSLPKIDFQIWKPSGDRPIRAQSLVMKTTTENRPLEQVEADALIVVVFDGKPEKRFGAGDLSDSGEVSAKSLELTLLHRPQGIAAKRVLLVGAGKSDKFDAAELRKVTGVAVRHLKSKSIKNIAVILESGFEGQEFVTAAVEGAILGNFEPDRYKT